MATPVTGLLYGGTTQILAQVAEAAAIGLTVFGASLAFFKILDALKLLRGSRADELAALDVPEMGAEGYPDDWEPASDAVVYGRRSQVPTGLRAGATD